MREKDREWSCIINCEPSYSPHLSSSADWGKLSFECTVPLRETILDRGKGGNATHCWQIWGHSLTGDPSVFKSHKMLGWRCCAQSIWSLIYPMQGTVMETSDSKWFTTIQLAQHRCPLSWQKRRKKGDGPLSFLLYTPLSLIPLQQYPTMHLPSVWKREKEERGNPIWPWQAC